ncbi:hypothetical protein BB934_32850 (plasmid) [Microvirga ossetica]|uniref:Uncharacterized protein n=1 Tax=Microvirga ossetica TaxID=1882682 RepID=A0A1B2ESP9_9HYPH|nr:hypothetical protein [Microvirga ossetica]ANY83004.1 hypothetical protein BB934_32850 [Microvirga ossetica]
MIKGYPPIDAQTMGLVREFIRQYGCPDEVALKYLLKVGKYPQKANEDDKAYAARLDRLSGSNVVVAWGLRAANDL